MRDTTASRVAETTLRESEAQHRAVVDVLSEGVVQYDRKGHITLHNAAAENILGLTRAQLLEQSLLDPSWRMVHEDGSPFTGDEHPAMLALHTREAQEGFVFGVYKPGGTLSWILVNCQPLWRPGESSAYAVVSSLTDVTHMKQPEARLSHAALHDALTGLPGRGPARAGGQLPRA